MKMKITADNKAHTVSTSWVSVVLAEDNSAHNEM